ncbi:MAG: hypothetical protein HY909_29385 [Deltaproteobacteria bacterium]|nr:hypothetical protein [Deltaproteobacteria bacterium]
MKLTTTLSVLWLFPGLWGCSKATTVEEHRTCARLAVLCPHDGGVQELRACAQESG